MVRGAIDATQLRRDSWDFVNIGYNLERADNTARLLDVKYYVLLPSAAGVGSAVDNAQWEMILRGVSAESAFRMIHGQGWGARDIARFLILDGRMPRSLSFCYDKIGSNLGYLEREYGLRQPSHDLAEAMCRDLARASVERIFEDGLHEVLQDFTHRNARLAAQIETDFRFAA